MIATLEARAKLCDPEARRTQEEERLAIAFERREFGVGKPIDFAAMQRTLEAVLGVGAGRVVQQICSRGYSPTAAHAAVAAAAPWSKHRAATLLQDAEKDGRRTRGSLARHGAAWRVWRALGPLGASDWWLGCDPAAIDEDVGWPDYSWDAWQEERREVEAPYNERSLKLTALYVQHCVPLRGATPEPQVQPWPDADEYMPWPVDWFYDPRFCVDGEPRSLLPSDCPATDATLGYPALREHWAAMSEMEAAGNAVRCAHGNAQHGCATCFDDELRKVVQLRFAGDDAREACCRKLSAEEAAVREAYCRSAEERFHRQTAEEEARRAQEEQEEQQRREEARREEEESARMKAALLAREEERQRAEAALVERLLAERPAPHREQRRAVATALPVYARRCLGDRCAQVVRLQLPPRRQVPASIQGEGPVQVPRRTTQGQLRLRVRRPCCRSAAVRGRC